MKPSRRFKATPAALIAALVSLAQPCLSDALLENGMHAGSLVEDDVTYGWFVQGEERGLAFKAALSAQLAFRVDAPSQDQPDFVVFVASTAVTRNGALNPEVFAFLTQAQIQDLQAAGLGQKDCDPITAATQSFQVVTFVTVRLDQGSSPAADTQILSDCLHKVLATLN